MRNLLCCKGCDQLCSRVVGNLESMYCKADRKFKAADKKEAWVQYSNKCPLKKYLGKADFKENPVIYTWEE